MLEFMSQLSWLFEGIVTAILVFFLTSLHDKKKDRKRNMNLLTSVTYELIYNLRRYTEFMEEMDKCDNMVLIKPRYKNKAWEETKHELASCLPQFVFNATESLYEGLVELSEYNEKVFCCTPELHKTLVDTKEKLLEKTTSYYCVLTKINYDIHSPKDIENYSELIPRKVIKKVRSMK
ncbi:MAG: hypothetical protein VR69_16075 [Peptococcaceae bacterium BRH_c4b]|nr:MAG: hypothetical protein VR69_16075 [Peptococcaceae bacterium BRH_c4b]